MNMNLILVKKLPTKRHLFTPEEDARLSMLVERMGPRRWDAISSMMPNRSARQCRDRYSNYLAPGFFNGEWSREEDEVLFRQYQLYGPKWTLINKALPMRSPNSIKNRWNYFVSRTNFVQANQKGRVVEESDFTTENETKNEDSEESTTTDEISDEDWKQKEEEFDVIFEKIAEDDKMKDEIYEFCAYGNHFNDIQLFSF
ncbi:Myb-like DNA-binding domain containing protein [Tritrichomonas foetus]|uniref:Myb-like DNA-binding domain containing protein n=1 Tax=Tritrichomonas foetus TaxID=1144522 RepID=A0A1J4JRT3_9EUKA|nr:Myb-like DNA-binding domain containing protein [Tritrichomonas foetus]|eukprot:OHT01458.1 Myb-like DNA-binding domain containing protein [Tritrichomonas foetus]